MHISCGRASGVVKSSRKAFCRKTNHIRHIHMAGKRDRDNNKMEMLSSEIRYLEKVFLDLKRLDTSVIGGMKAYCNCAKPYPSLRGKTPAAEALIRVGSRNKWLALIQNVGLHQDNSV